MKGKMLVFEEEGRRYYAFQEEKALLLSKILSSHYEVLEEFKNDRRTYVAKIRYEKQNYILKKIYYPKAWKRFLARWKQGEALSTLQNVEEAREEGLQELAEILAVALQQEKNIYEEYLLMPYYEGEKKQSEEDFRKVLAFLGKMHAKGRFHGDCNPNNFLEKEGRLFVLDTKAKNYAFGNYRAHYDILTWWKHKASSLLLGYPYPKNTFYYLALGMRKLRNVKNKWKDLRDVSE